MSHYNKILTNIKDEGLYKSERTLTTAQGVEVETKNGDQVLNFCANNYLGLANHSRLIDAAKSAMDDYGFGMASVRFICGTQDIHKNLEEEISIFFKTDDTILYTSCFDANGGLFETILNENDAIISDSLNHASIIDGIRLCKAKRYRYQHSDMKDLEKCLQQADSDSANHKVIVSDGVFSMDGTYAKLDKIVELAEKYNALIMLDDCHATGFVGENGRGTAEYFGLEGKIDILTGTLGKALGGASGGFICAKENVIKLLKQRSRPYLFSNALSPSIVSASLKALEIVKDEPERRERIKENTAYFRDSIKSLGFEVKGDMHPITPVMLGDAKKAQEMSKMLLEEGLYAIGFFYPVVPKGEARIRLQITSEHTKQQLDQAIEIFDKVGKELNII